MRRHLGLSRPEYTQKMSTTVAVIGASSNRQKYGNKALRALRDQGYTVIPINPKEPEVEGEKATGRCSTYRSQIDMATFYVAPPVGMRILDDVVKKGIPRSGSTPAPTARRSWRERKPWA